MCWSEALNVLKEKAENTTNRYVSVTLDNIHSVLLRANKLDSDRWSAKIETVVAYVEAGNYIWSHPTAVKMLNKRKYTINNYRRIYL